MNGRRGYRRGRHHPPNNAPPGQPHTQPPGLAVPPSPSNPRGFLRFQHQRQVQKAQHEQRVARALASAAVPEPDAGARHKPFPPSANSPLAYRYTAQQPRPGFMQPPPGLLMPGMPRPAQVPPGPGVMAVQPRGTPVEHVPGTLRPAQVPPASGGPDGWPPGVSVEQAPAMLRPTQLPPGSGVVGAGPLGVPKERVLDSRTSPQTNPQPPAQIQSAAMRSAAKSSSNVQSAAVAPTGPRFPAHRPDKSQLAASIMFGDMGASTFSTSSQPGTFTCEKPAELPPWCQPGRPMVPDESGRIPFSFLDKPLFGRPGDKPLWERPPIPVPWEDLPRPSREKMEAQGITQWGGPNQEYPPGIILDYKLGRTRFETAEEKNKNENKWYETRATRAMEQAGASAVSTAEATLIMQELDLTVGREPSASDIDTASAPVDQAPQSVHGVQPDKDKVAAPQASAHKADRRRKR